jgi:hypothetical protein
VPLQLLCQKDRHHRLALAWPARDPQQARVVIVAAIAIAAQPRAVARVVRDPLAGAFDSCSFRAGQAFAVDVGIGEEERVATRGRRWI